MELVTASERLTRIFGEWPSFHDAEVVRVVLDRAGTDGPTLETQIHVFQRTCEVDRAGYYVLKKRTLVTMNFSGICLQQLRWFNHQNVLFGLDLVEVDPDQNEGRRVRVEMPSSYGIEAAFECVSCEVTDVQPFDASA